MSKNIIKIIPGNQCNISNSTTLTVAANKFDIYQMLYVQFDLLMMGGKTALRHEEH
jgi:hypothetical protein